MTATDPEVFHSAYEAFTDDDDDDDEELTIIHSAAQLAPTRRTAASPSAERRNGRPWYMKRGADDGDLPAEGISSGQRLFLTYGSRKSTLDLSSRFCSDTHLNSYLSKKSSSISTLRGDAKSESDPSNSPPRFEIRTLPTPAFDDWRAGHKSIKLVDVDPQIVVQDEMTGEVFDSKTELDDEPIKKLDFDPQSDERANHLRTIRFKWKAKETRLTEIQVVGVRWLLSVFERNDGGCILADEMGLGKTVESLIFLSQIVASLKRALILAPVTSLGDWEIGANQLLRGNFKIYVYHGNHKQMVLRDFFADHGPKPKILITTFQTLRNSEELLRVAWTVWIADEATQIKNSQTLSWKTAKNIRARCKILLTGTPILNDIIELWALMHICRPDLLGPLKEFKLAYNALISRKGHSSSPMQAFLLRQLRSLIEPSVLRRTKRQMSEESHVGASIPFKLLPKHEVLLLHDLSDVQYDLYELCRSRLNPGITVASSLMSLCDHPALLLNLIQGEELGDDEFRLYKGLIPDVKGRRSGQLLLTPNELQYYSNQIDKSSPACMRSVCTKFQTLHFLIPQLIDEGHHKVVLFSKRTRTLDMIEQYVLCGFPHINYSRIDGKVKPIRRQKILEDFAQSDSLTSLMLVSTGAGGQGINLTQADRVILVDSDWTPANDRQAIDRVHRLGQTRPVVIYRLIYGGTIEGLVILRQFTKSALSAAVLDKPPPLRDLTREERDEFLSLSSADECRLRKVIEEKMSKESLSTILNIVRSDIGGSQPVDVAELCGMLKARQILSMNEAIEEPQLHNSGSESTTGSVVESFAQSESARKLTDRP